MSTSKLLNLCFSLWAVCVVASILSPLLLLLSHSLILFNIGCALLIILTVFFQYTLLYQCWNLIPRNIASTTPAKAVGFLLIPIFNFYWMFIAYNRLGKDMNKTFQCCGVQFQIKERLGWDYCISTLVFSVAYWCTGLPTWNRWFFNFDTDLFFIIGFVSQIVGCVVGLVSIFVLIAFLRAIKNGAIALLEQGKQ